ncbi:MAG: ABC-F family ATP-binding cassette domain-containing protein [Leptospiraceae bacterium]|nr:ABC-F family ATP-binding cassette domain-containing protein [Leptospiraceae bacterium]
MKAGHNIVMHILSVENLSLEIAGKTLFKEISFGMQASEKIGLIGVNGCGKSSLMRILAGQQEADSGRVDYRRKLRLAWSDQRLPEHSSLLVKDYIYQTQSPRLQLLRRYEQICQQLAETHTGSNRQHKTGRLQNELDEINHQLQAEDAWTFEQQILSILREFGITDLNQPIESLSGGMRKKLALAQALIDESDLLLLDEPTNHLDAATVEWLESYVKRRSAALILVTHDRYLLEVLCDRILEIHDQRIFSYAGSWQTWLEKRAEREELAKRNQAGALRRYKGELEWLRRQPKARGTKSKSRIERAQALAEQAKPRRETDHAGIRFESGSQRQGKRILSAHNIGKSWNSHWVVRNFDYHFKQNERIGIIGPNGCGKSTLLAMLVQRLQPDEGSVSAGVNTSFGVFDQLGLDLPTGQRVMDYVRHNMGDAVVMTDGSKIRAADLLERFYFDDALAYRRIELLSGGERRRLQLIQVLLQNPNFLVLDEPGNDLDIQTLAALEDYLQNFNGCVLTVSHDRYFLDRVVNRLLVFDSDPQKGLQFFEGNYSDWLQQQAPRAADTSKSLPNGQPVDQRNVAQRQSTERPQRPPRKRFSYKEQREFKSLEDRIAQLEQRTSEINAQIAAGIEDYTELERLTGELQATSAELETSYERWQVLAESVEELE